MVKITHKEVAMLIGKSENYIKVLLHRRKVFLKQDYLEKIIDLISEYRMKGKK